jgi:hypothetical protein
MNDVDLLRQTLRTAIRGLCYHEEELIAGGRRMAAAKALLVRLQCDFTLEQAFAFFNEDEDGEDLTTVDDYIKHFIGKLAFDLEYHHRSLAGAEAEVAAARAIIQRGKYTEISFDEVRAQIKKERE